VPFVERDVSVDHAAAQEMVRRSGQMGVPVIVAGDEVIVGFDRPRLERVAARYARPSSEAAGPKLGLLVRDLPGGGVEIGGAKAGSPAERAGVRPGDILEAVNGQPIRSVADLTHLTSTLRTGATIDVSVRRQGQSVRLSMAT